LFWTRLFSLYQLGCNNSGVLTENRVLTDNQLLKLRDHANLVWAQGVPGYSSMFYDQLDFKTYESAIEQMGWEYRLKLYLY